MTGKLQNCFSLVALCTVLTKNSTEKESILVDIDAIIAYESPDEIGKKIDKICQKQKMVL